MDIASKIVAALFILWAGAMVVGLLIALAPVILFVAGFILMVAVLAFVGRLLASWFFY